MPSGTPTAMRLGGLHRRHNRFLASSDTATLGWQRGTGTAQIANRRQCSTNLEGGSLPRPFPAKRPTAWLRRGVLSVRSSARRPGQRRSIRVHTSPQRISVLADKSHNQPTPQSPLEVFDLPKTVSREDIERRYKELALQYHPDRVEHLGADLKKLAHEKMIQIQAAYQQLLKDG